MLRAIGYVLFNKLVELWRVFYLFGQADDRSMILIHIGNNEPIPFSADGESVSSE